MNYESFKYTSEEGVGHLIFCLLYTSDAADDTPV